MHARSVLYKQLADALDRLDRRNVRTLLAAVEACLRGRRLVLMELARQWPGALKVWAPLKRLDRLLSNPAVQDARCRLYQSAVGMVNRAPEPVLVVDWSELKRDGRWHLLRAGLVVRGRTLTVYEEVHPQRLLGAATVHRWFLRRLAQVLGSQVRPVVITDAGFKVPWFKQVEALGWHWIGRVRGQVSLRPAAPAFSPFRRVQAWYRQALPKAQGLGRVLLTAQHRLACRAVLMRRPPKGRHQILTRSGRRASSGQAGKMARTGGEPWFLVYSESLSRLTVHRVTALYAKRMQIESSFRDLKSHRYGAAFEDTLTRSAERLQMLLLIHMLASLVAWIAAMATVSEHERRFRVSLLRRGWEHLRRTEGRIRGAPAGLSRLSRLAFEPVADP